MLIVLLPLLRRYLSSYAKLNAISGGLKSQIKDERHRKMHTKKKNIRQLSQKDKHYLKALENQKISMGDYQENVYEEKIKLQDVIDVSNLFRLASSFIT